MLTRTVLFVGLEWSAQQISQLPDTVTRAAKSSADYLSHNIFSNNTNSSPSPPTSTDDDKTSSKDE